MQIKCSYSELVQLEKLTPSPKNTNKHPEKQIVALGKVIEARGWRHPIIVSKRSGFIAAGEGRYLAAKKSGWEKVPVDYQDFENEADEYAFLESDNHIANYAEFDKDKFLENLKELELDIEEIDFETEFGILDFELPKILEPEEYGDKNSEIDTDNFGNDLEHACPKCGFEFND